MKTKDIPLFLCQSSQQYSHNVSPFTIYRNMNSYFLSIAYFHYRAGVVLSNGKVWKEHRNFVHSVFRSLGVGKKTYEDTIAAEMAQLTATIEELGGTSFSPGILFEQAISNIICTVVFGTQYKYSDQEFQKVSGLNLYKKHTDINVIPRRLMYSNTLLHNVRKHNDACEY